MKKDTLSNLLKRFNHVVTQLETNIITKKHHEIIGNIHIFIYNDIIEDIITTLDNLLNLFNDKNELYEQIIYIKEIYLCIKKTFIKNENISITEFLNHENRNYINTKLLNMPIFYDISISIIFKDIFNWFVNIYNIPHLDKNILKKQRKKLLEQLDKILKDSYNDKLKTNYYNEIYFNAKLTNYLSRLIEQIDKCHNIFNIFEAISKNESFIDPLSIFKGFPELPQIDNIFLDKKPNINIMERKKKMSKLELIGNKWIVENQENTANLRIDVKNINESIYLLNCKKCVLTIVGKANVIIIENCIDIGIVFDSVISTVQIIRCIKLEIQPIKGMSTITIDKSDDINLYLSKNIYENTQIYSTSSSNMRISCIEDDETKEYIIPDQFCTQFINNKFVTKPATYIGA